MDYNEEQPMDEFIEMDVTMTQIEAFVYSWIQYWMLGEQDPGYESLKDWLRQRTLEDAISAVNEAIEESRSPEHPMAALEFGIIADHRIPRVAARQVEELYNIWGGETND